MPWNLGLCGSLSAASNLLRDPQYRHQSTPYDGDPPILGVPIISTIVCWCLFWGPTTKYSRRSSFDIAMSCSGSLIVLSQQGGGGRDTSQSSWTLDTSALVSCFRVICATHEILHSPRHCSELPQRLALCNHWVCQKRAIKKSSILAHRNSRP